MNMYPIKSILRQLSCLEMSSLASYIVVNNVIAVSKIYPQLLV